MKLGLHEIIDNRWEEWNTYDAVLKIILVENDLETYTRAKYQESFYRAGSLSVWQIKELQQSFNSQEGKEDRKKIYTEFIAKMSKPDKKSNLVSKSEQEEEHNESCSLHNEYAAIQKLAANDEEYKATDEYIQEKSVALEQLNQKVGLSEVEIVCLDFVKDRNNNKHALLTLFTLKGIVQIANRAAYKMYYTNNL